MTDKFFLSVAEALEKDYVVEAEIGYGGVAVVYRATHRESQRPVAIKVLAPAHTWNARTRERFIREARIGSVLVHPGIVPIYNTGVHGDLAYYAMRLVEGESLAERLSWDPFLPIEETRAFLAGIADALEFAHQAGVIHRDVKPGNIMIDAATGQPMVTDFGLARTRLGDTSITRTGDAVGTPAYMSPEQAIGEKDVDARSDVYSLGALAYCMIAGEPPFRAKNIPTMLMKHIGETPRPLATLRPGVPESLAQVIERALAKSPEDRWQSAAEFRDALGDVSGISMAAFQRQRPVHQLPRLPTPTRFPDGKGVLTPALEKKIRRFRVVAGISAGFFAITPAIKLISAQGFEFAIPVAGFAVLYVAYAMSLLWADGASFAQILGRARREAPQAPPDIATLVAATLTKDLQPDHVVAEREARMDFHSIELVLARLTPDQRARIPNTEKVARGLFEDVQRLTAELDNVENELLGEVVGGAGGVSPEVPQASAGDTAHRELEERRAKLVEEIEDASAGLLMLRMDLISLEASRFEKGLEAMLTTTERARTLTSGAA